MGVRFSLGVQTEVKDGDVKADDAGEARKEEQQPAAAEKRKRKRLSEQMSDRLNLPLN